MTEGRFTPLSCLQEQDRESIAKHLDLLHKWKDLAHSLGFACLDIKWIESKSNGGGSAALQLLDQMQSRNSHSLEQVMEQLQELNILSVLHYLTLNYPRIRKTFEDSHKCSAGTLAKRSKVAQMCLGRKPLSSSEPLQSCHLQTCERRTRLFVTHSTPDHAAVLQMVNCLHKNHFAVSVDCRERHLCRDQHLACIRKRFQSTNFVLVLLTPCYLDTVRGEAVEVVESRMRTAHVFKLMQREVEGRMQEGQDGREVKSRKGIMGLKKSLKKGGGGVEGEGGRKVSNASKESRFVGVILTKSFKMAGFQDENINAINNNKYNPTNNNANYNNILHHLPLKEHIRCLTPTWMAPLYCWPEEFHSLLSYLSIPQDVVHSFTSSLHPSGLQGAGDAFEGVDRLCGVNERAGDTGGGGGESRGCSVHGDLKDNGWKCEKDKRSDSGDVSTNGIDHSVLPDNSQDTPCVMAGRLASLKR